MTEKGYHIYRGPHGTQEGRIEGDEIVTRPVRSMLEEAWARLGAVVREPDHIQIPVSIAESAQAALDDLLYGEEEGREWDREVLAQLEEAIHNGFMHDGPGEINAPWRVRLRLLRAKLRATRRRGWS